MTNSLRGFAMDIQVPWDLLGLDRACACEFLGFFSRFEYALKVSGFVKNTSGRAEPGWDQFASVDGQDARFRQICDKCETLKKAVDHFVNEPPEIESVRNGQLKWEKSGHTINPLSVKSLCVEVRLVRNNLFHGGKFSSITATDGVRNAQLVNNSLIILRALLVINDQVREAFLS